MHAGGDAGFESVVGQGGQSGEGGSAGGGDLVDQVAWAHAGLSDHLGGADDGLDGELQGVIGGQAFLLGLGGEGFDKGIDVGRAAAGESCDGVELGFSGFAGHAG